jgi:hypothetical protein
MAAARFNFTIEQGATFTHTIEAEDEAGAAIDFTGASVKMQVRSLVDSATILVELSSANGRAVVASTKITLTLTAAETAALTPWNLPAVYDLEVTYAAGNIERLLDGKVFFDKEITR